MEPCLGENLYKLMNSRALPENMVRGFLQQVCSAVAYLHSRDVIHRDIKPENILVDGDIVKLCDFGWAVHSPLLRSTRCGTPIYTPPEMIKMEFYNSKVDVWCIGILTFEMLYATVPFEIRHFDELSKIVEEEIRFPMSADISEEAENFMRRCLNKSRR